MIRNRKFQLLLLGVGLVLVFRIGCGVFEHPTIRMTKTDIQRDHALYPVRFQQVRVYEVPREKLYGTSLEWLCHLTDPRVDSVTYVEGNFRYTPGLAHEERVLGFRYAYAQEDGKWVTVGAAILKPF